MSWGKGVVIAVDPPDDVKKIHSIEPDGTEHVPNKVSAEEKLLADALRIVDGRGAKGEGSEDEREPEAPPVWPWLSVIEHLQNAQEELRIILDVTAQVEQQQLLMLENIAKPKPLLQETCNELALRVATKQSLLKEVGAKLKKSAKEMRSNVAQEGEFYGVLQMLQRSWKVKRSRPGHPSLGVGRGGMGASVPSESGFAVDLSYPGLWEGGIPITRTAAALSSVEIGRDAEGHLTAFPPPNQPLRKLVVSLSGLREREAKWVNRATPPREAENGVKGGGGTVW